MKQHSHVLYVFLHIIDRFGDSYHNALEEIYEIF